MVEAKCKHCLKPYDKIARLHIYCSTQCRADRMVFLRKQSMRHNHLEIFKNITVGMTLPQYEFILESSKKRGFSYVGFVRFLIEQAMEKEEGEQE